MTKFNLPATYPTNDILIQFQILLNYHYENFNKTYSMAMKFRMYQDGCAVLVHPKIALWPDWYYKIQTNVFKWICDNAVIFLVEQAPGPSKFVFRMGTHACQCGNYTDLFVPTIICMNEFRMNEINATD